MFSVNRCKSDLNKSTIYNFQYIFIFYVRFNSESLGNHFKRILVPMTEFLLCSVDWRKGNKTSYPTLPDDKQRDISTSCFQIEQERVSKINDRHSIAEPVIGESYKFFLWVFPCIICACVSVFVHTRICLSVSILTCRKILILIEWM